MGEPGAAERTAYYAAKFLGQAGQNLMLAALFVVAGTSNTAAIGLGSIFVATLVPAILLGLPGGALADRMGAPRGYLLGAVLRLAAIAGGLSLIATPSLAFVIAVAYSAGSQVFTPAELAMVRMVQRETAGRVHAFLIAVQYAGQGVAVLLVAPTLYFLGGPEVMLMGAGAIYLGVIAAAAFLMMRLPISQVSDAERKRDAFSFRETFAYFGSERRAGYAVGLLAYKATVARCIFVALPLYMQRDMGLGQAGVAYLMVPGVAGITVGLIWSGRSLSLSSATSAMRLALLGMTVSVLALAALDYGVTAAAQYSQVPPIARLEASMNTTFVVAFPVAFLLGTCFSRALTSARAVLTETAPAGQQARVFASTMTLTESVIIFPLMLAGVGTQYAGARPMLAVLGVVGVSTLLLLELAQLRTRPAVEGVGRRA
jgi:hypothetical protein